MGWECVLLFRDVAYALAALTAVAGVLILLSDGDYTVPGSGRSLATPCAFFFWFLAIIFWALGGAETAPEADHGTLLDAGETDDDTQP